MTLGKQRGPEDFLNGNSGGDESCDVGMGSDVQKACRENMVTVEGMITMMNVVIMMRLIMLIMRRIMAATMMKKI